jgi:hypothetical protein
VIERLFILNMVITWISWGAHEGDINIAPLGLFKVIFVSQKVQYVPFLSIIILFQAKVSLRETLA